MPFNIGIGELLIVLVVALLVFGGKLPEVGRSLGKGLKEFKEGLKGVRNLADEIEDEEPLDTAEEEGATEEEGEKGTSGPAETTPGRSP